MIRRLAITTMVLTCTTVFGSIAEADPSDAGPAIRPIPAGTASAMRETMNAGLAHIAMRGAVPTDRAGQLTQQDRLSLFLLLALRARTNDHTP